MVLHEIEQSGRKPGMTTREKVLIVQHLVSDGLKQYVACERVGLSQRTYQWHVAEMARQAESANPSDGPDAEG